MAAIPKPVRFIDDARRVFAREQGCIIAKFHRCEGLIEAHHVIEKGQGRVGSKVSDRKTVGLCQAAHRLANRRDVFESMYPVILREEYERLNRMFDALPKVKRKVSVKLAVIEIKCSCGKRHRKSVPVKGGRRYFCTTIREFLIAS